MVWKGLVWLWLGWLSSARGSEGDERVSVLRTSDSSLAKERRYLLYEVNPGEGFNLRRDVHMRVTNVVRQLREAGHNFILVLPPFSQSYHWQTPELRHKQNNIPWGLWFDLPSLNIHVPSIEFSQYRKETGQSKVVRLPQLFYLQHYAEGWGDGWAEKWHYRPCIEAEGRYYQLDTDTNLWRGYFWGLPYDEAGVERLDCISIMGQSSTLVQVLTQTNLSDMESLMVERAETILHDHFGDRHYWEARRSMRYAKALRDLGDAFRREELDSEDEADQTLLAEDWREMRVNDSKRVAKGGPYLAVHWRRKDFLRAHGKELPSIQGTADQISALLSKLQLSLVFLATDAKEAEVAELRALIPVQFTLKIYKPSREVLHTYLDGGVAIIDQWICAHARYFIGSHVSTFSFRIQDEREILGFPPETTFNRLCPDDTPDCEQPAKWKIVT